MSGGRPRPCSPCRRNRRGPGNNARRRLHPRTQTELGGWAGRGVFDAPCSTACLAIAAAARDMDNSRAAVEMARALLVMSSGPPHDPYLCLELERVDALEFQERSRFLNGTARRSRRGSADQGPGHKTDVSAKVWLVVASSAGASLRVGHAPSRPAPTPRMGALLAPAVS